MTVLLIESIKNLTFKLILNAEFEFHMLERLKYLRLNNLIHNSTAVVLLCSKYESQEICLITTLLIEWQKILKELGQT